MDIYEAMDTRKTIREFSAKPIPAELLHKIIQAGLKAPSNDHMRRWEFIVVKEAATRLRIVDAAEEISETYDEAEYAEIGKRLGENAKEMYIYADKVQKRMILSAPEVIIVCYKFTKEIKDCTKINELNYLASAWCCIENMLLAMAAEGIFGVTRIPHHTDKIRKILSIPEDYEIPVILPLGYPAENAARCKQNPIDCDGKIHIDRW